MYAIIAASGCNGACRLFRSSDDLIADLARRQLVVVERHGQAQIIRFCANVAARVKPGS
jgi:hypothetical protein